MATTDDNLLTDRRGVVAVVGLAMAVFLTALVYYEMGVGDAITFKEQLQDASDASGFAAAVYHAKGMNMIVLINLIMAAVLAIIVILRVLQLLFGIVAALIPAICWIPGLEWLCPAEALADEAEEWATTTAEVMDPIVRAALMGLNDASTAIAVGMPWVALIKSGTVGTQYYPQVTSQAGGGTIMLSMSLIPDMTWIPPVNGAASSASSGISGAVGLGGEDEPGASKVEGKRWGLPVQEGEFKVLCDQAGQALPDLLEWAITAAVTHDPNASPPKWLSWVNNIIGGLVGSWPEFFCDSSEMSTGKASSMIQSQAQSDCNSQKTQWDQCVKQIELYGTNPPLPAVPSGGGALPANPINSLNADSTGPCKDIGSKVTAHPAFDMNACMTEETEKITNAANEANNDSAWDSTKNSTLPKAIYAYAANGNDYMAVWSFGWGTFSNNEELGVHLASWAGTPTATQTVGGMPANNPSHPTMLTKAEFFYAVENPCTADNGKQDYGTKGSATLCSTAIDMPFWGDYQADTTWNPRWKARLRRVAPPMIPVGQMASSGFGSLMEAALTKGIGMIPKVGSVSEGAGASEVVEFITGWLQLGGGMADGAIAGQIEKSSGYLH
jgi:hypothetical protein